MPVKAIPDGYHAVYGKVKSVYDLYAGGSSPQIREVDDDVGHSDPPRFRRETREWMNRWLRNDATPVAEEPDVEAGAEPAETLACLSGPPRDAINYHVHDLFTSPVRLTAPANAVGPALRRKDLIAQLREKVFRWFPRESLPFETTVSRSCSTSTEGMWRHARTGTMKSLTYRVSSVDCSSAFFLANP